MSVILIFSLFLATNEVVWNIIPNILRNIQFGWRMTLFVAIAVSILFGYTINFLKNDLKKVFLIGLIIIFSITNFITSQMTFKVEEDSLNYLSDITYVKWAQEYLPVSASSHALELKFKKEYESINNVVNEKTNKKNRKELIIPFFNSFFNLTFQKKFLPLYMRRQIG